MGLPCQRHQGPSSTQRQLIQRRCCLLLLCPYFPSFFCGIVSPQQLQKTRKLPGRRESRYRMISSITPAPEHRLCSGTGKRISKADGGSSSSSSCLCQARHLCGCAGSISFQTEEQSEQIQPYLRSMEELGEKKNSITVGKTKQNKKKKPLKDLRHPETNYFRIIFGDKQFSPISAGGEGERCFFHKGKNIQNLEGAKKIFIPNISPSAARFSFFFFFFIQTRVCGCFYHPNYSQWCQGDSLEYPTCFKQDQKYRPSKEPNQWHKSTIVRSSLLSWTIPLYCVFIIPLKWVYRVGQVEHSHA